MKSYRLLGLARPSYDKTARKTADRIETQEPMPAIQGRHGLILEEPPRTARYGNISYLVPSGHLVLVSVKMPQIHTNLDVNCTLAHCFQAFSYSPMPRLCHEPFNPTLLLLLPPLGELHVGVRHPKTFLCLIITVFVREPVKRSYVRLFRGIS